MGAFLHKNVPARQIADAKAAKETEASPSQPVSAPIEPPKQATGGSERGMLGQVRGDLDGMGAIKKKKATSKDIIGGSGTGGKTTMGA